MFSNGINFIANFVKISQLLEKSRRRTRREIDTQTA
jgi:hypothetical protein